MAAILKDIAAIGKKKKNEQQGYNFRSIDQFYDELHPIFSAHGVICLPSVEKIESVERINSKGNKIFFSYVTTSYNFTATDGSSVTARTAGEGFDSGDKATAKAMSAAHKYLLIQTFLIPVADLPDADYDSTVDAREELKEIEEHKRRTQEIERQEQELARKRETLRQQSEATGGLPPGATPAEPAPKTVQEPAKPATPAATAPEPEKAPTRARKPAAPPVEPEPAEQTGPAEPEKAAAPTRPAWFDYVIVPEAINHSAYKGKTLGSLSLETLVKLEVNWIGRYADEIEKSPVKKALRAQVVEALKARRAEDQIPH